MKWSYITFRSITPAQRGEETLRRRGIRCALQRTPRQLAERGCGYCLRLKQEDLLDGAEALQKARVPFGKLYLLDENGRTEEMTI